MKQKLLAKAGILRLYKTKDDRGVDVIKMTGGKFGSHQLREKCYNDRVACHWQGYMEINEINWKGHYEYFPNNINI